MNSQKDFSPVGIDVVIPVYNGERYLLDAVRSVIDQTFRPYRIIIVDDGSTDSTPILVKEIESPVPIDYVRKDNGGLSSARNAGIVKCTSEYVAFLDADDIWLPHKLEHQLSLFSSPAFRDLGVVYCDFTVIDTEGKTVNAHRPSFQPPLRGHVLDQLLFCNGISGSGSAIVVKRTCFRDAGLFDEALTAYEDWDMWLRLAEHYSFDCSPEVLLKIRRHDAGMQADQRHMLFNYLRFCEKWCSRVSASHGCIASWREGVSWLIYHQRSFPLLREVTRNLSSQIRRMLFRPSFGSIWLYIAYMTAFHSMRSVFIGLWSRHQKETGT